MNFEIILDPQANKFLDKLEKNIALRIINKLDEVKKDPFRYLEHYEGDYDYKLRVGDYRVLIDVDFIRGILFFRIIDKRGRVYKR